MNGGNAMTTPFSSEEMEYYQQYLRDYVDIQEARSGVLRDRVETARLKLVKLLQEAPQDAEIDDLEFFARFQIKVEKYLDAIQTVWEHENNDLFPATLGNA